MAKKSATFARLLATASMSALMLGATVSAIGQEAPIVQPGAPGEAVKNLSADEAVKIAENSYSPDDVTFMQNMIPHHAQAVVLSELVPDRTNNDEVKDIAGRILAAQSDEIKFMQGWLSERGEFAPKVAGDEGTHAGHEGHGGHGGHVMSAEEMVMMGMASQEDLARLATLEGVEFDNLFLSLMITHHEGAVRMVENLLLQPGSAYDPVLFDFTNDVTNDQSAEIKRMNLLLVGLSKDPRAGLKAGFEDADDAIMNLVKLASLPKPAGFFDPENPAGLPPIIEPEKKDDAEAEETEAEAPSREEDEQSLDETQWGERFPFLSFSNTDMAFFDDKLIAGNYHGFNVYQLNDDAAPTLISSVVCPGGQGDVSVVGDILIMSVEQTRGRVDCGLEGISEDVSAERFRGIRIFDISDLARPVQVGQVQTCRGSHTHSVVTSDENTIIVYNSGTAIVRKEEELEGCIGEGPGDDRTALFSIDVIEIPVAEPAKARIVDSPRVFANEETGQIAGLWTGGSLDDDSQETRRTDQCHDITIFPELKLAAGACSGNGILLDISDPMKPKRIDDVFDNGFAYWHSATFNNDGTKVLFTDEWGGGARPRCRAHDPSDWGADAIYDIKDGKLEFKSYYKLSAPQVESENCVAHNGSVIPVPGRDIFVQAWYQGGLSVVDFTDSENPIEIAYFDRGPIHEDRLVLAGYWSTYWYDGKIYGTEIARGLDIFELMPSEYLTENEIAAAAIASQGDFFNPQQQFKVTWPDEPVVAKAYVDQLLRADAMKASLANKLTAALNSAEASLEKGETSKSVARDLNRLSRQASKGKGDLALTQKRSDLADMLRKIAGRIS